MKILVLSPIYDTMAPAQEAIFSQMSKEAQDVVFFESIYASYLISYKKATNWAEASYLALKGGEHAYNIAKEKKTNLIICGNISTSFKFDTIFNFQDIDEDLPYQDVMINYIKKQFDKEEPLRRYFDSLYRTADSTFTLHNCKATADFLSRFLLSEPKLEELKKKYNITLSDENKIKALRKKGN